MPGFGCAVAKDKLHGQGFGRGLGDRLGDWSNIKASGSITARQFWRIAGGDVIEWVYKAIGNRITRKIGAKQEGIKKSLSSGRSY